MNVFQMLTKRMDYANRSLELAAENLTNKYTPLYKARRLGPLKFDPSSAAEGTLQVTHPGHITSQMKAGFRVIQKSGGVETFSGNTVSQDEELRRANEANLTHKQMTNLVQAQVQMLETVLKR